MTRILTSALVRPPYVVPQEQVARHIATWLERNGRNPRRLIEIFARAGVERRYSSVPPDEVFVDRPLSTRNATYADKAIELSEQAALTVLGRLDLPPTEIALVLSVSCTGFLIPSIDAHLANRLPLGPEVRRMPLTLLGCAGGAMGLSHAADWLRAHPRAYALVVAVELASQSFQVEDLSMAHLVSCALFGDGAAASVLAGEEAPLVAERDDRRCTPRVVATRTRFFPDTLDAMGFDVRESGFHMILDPRIPEFLNDTIWPEVAAFLADHGTSAAELDHFLLHPGGRRILDVLEERIDRGPEAVALSRRVLADGGNLSSASILAVLAEHERAHAPRPGERALALAFGPGFNAEMLLLEWTT